MKWNSKDRKIISVSDNKNVTSLLFYDHVSSLHARSLSSAIDRAVSKSSADEVATVCNRETTVVPQEVVSYDRNASTAHSVPVGRHGFVLSTCTNVTFKLSSTDLTQA